MYKQVITREENKYRLVITGRNGRTELDTECYSEFSVMRKLYDWVYRTPVPSRHVPSYLPKGEVTKEVVYE